MPPHVPGDSAMVTTCSQPKPVSNKDRMLVLLEDAIVFGQTERLADRRLSSRE